MTNKIDKLSSYFNKIPELTDAAQKSVFFAKFPNREDKPVQYDKKLSTWSAVITESSLLLGEFSFSINELKNRFNLGIQPVCLDTVVSELVKSGAIQSKNEFMAPEQSWTGWAVGLMFSPVKKFASTRINPDDKYIALDAVKQRADELYSKYKDSTKLANDIYHDMADSLSSPQDLSILIQHLIKTKRATSFELNTLTGERLDAIKFATGEVTDAERGVLQMKLTSKRLETQRLELEEKVASLTEQAKQATKSKQKDKALLLLKQRRKLNDLCMKRMNMLDTLHQILEKIDEAHTNYEIMQAYKLGAETLKNVTKNYGLTKEAVDDIKDAVFETLADQQEIDDALAEPVSAFNYDEDELEEELNKLVIEDLPASTTSSTAVTEDDSVDDILAQLNSLKIVTESPQLPTKKEQEEKQLA